MSLPGTEMEQRCPKLRKTPLNVSEQAESVQTDFHSGTVFLEVGR